MNRRYFLMSLAASGAAKARPTPAARITKITLATIQGRFHKFVAMNSRDEAPKGHTYTNTLVRVATDQDVEGVGVMAYAEPDAPFHTALKRLIGSDPFALYSFRDGRFTGRASAYQGLLKQYKHLDGPLFDLIGKLRGAPCWKLLGDAVRERVEVYDGTLYFSDVWFKDRGAQAVVEEAVEAQKKGYLGVKLKVGRGWKWMSKDGGLNRDIEVLKAIRDAAGPELKINADANNGFRGDYGRAWELLRETRGINLNFIEEIFPEDVALYTKLRGQMKKLGLETRVADGENLEDAAELDPFLKPNRLMDIVQLDIRKSGFIEWMKLARMAKEAGAVGIPHNWAAQVGLFMSLHLAKAIENVAAAEDDRSTCDVIMAKGYDFEDGFYTVSNEPGLGLSVDGEIYREKYQAGEVIIS